MRNPIVSGFSFFLVLTHFYLRLAHNLRSDLPFHTILSYPWIIVPTIHHFIHLKHAAKYHLAFFSLGFALNGKFILLKEFIYIYKAMAIIIISLSGSITRTRA